jgi:Fe-S-cluster-containing dehydrogenase component/formate-dependent nitrite reductase membrane component NrfD
MAELPVVDAGPSAPKWAKVIDHTRCIGCHACSTACKAENEVPLSVNRTYVKSVDIGVFPHARRAFQVTRCNQCEDPPCTIACPTAAMHQREDGIVDFDKSICIACKACIAACPYDAIFINPEDHSAEKCNFCAHRLETGLEPACGVVCPTEAILVGDMNDPDSEVARVVHRETCTVRRPEKDTRPKLFYRGGTQATLDPLAARRPEGGLFLWSEQFTGEQHVISGNKEGGNSSATAVLSYDVPHKAPWDWRVSLYTWTKSVASGGYLVAALLVLFGFLDADSMVWRWIAPVVGGVFLAITGVLLIWDLEHPERFYYLFTKAQNRSWLVKGAYIISVYSAVLMLHFAASLFGWDGVHGPLMIVGIPMAVMTAVYTAYLFAQARARDLWQSPLLPPHMAVQGMLGGVGALLIVAAFDASLVPATTVDVLIVFLFAVALAHVLVMIGEISLTHPTTHAKLAMHEMTSGRYAGFFRVGFALMVLALAATGLSMVGYGAIGLAGAPLALVGLLLHEHAYVQAGQSIPLA